MSSSFMDNFHLEKNFGELVFTEKVMANRIPPSTFKQYTNAVKTNSKVTVEVADILAVALKDWAMERGATHFTHWFQPLTGTTAEKHDSFVSPNGDMSCLTRFTGRQLMMGEPDASSFPSGGLRVTHEARGYTIWDPITPPYISSIGDIHTLIIPACFISWKGHALDHKIPLLRSVQALSNAGNLLYEAIGQPGHTEWHSNSGVEQEFFLIDADHYNKRPDLVLTGRTLQGHRAPRDQEMSDHYFGPMPKGIIRCIDAIEKECWRLGIPIATRHQEVAPNQFEMAPVYQKGSIASDQNTIMMEVMKRIAPKFNLVALLHEKPFHGINGSGKHNNWSVGSQHMPNMMEPGDDPINNSDFMLAVAGVIRGVDIYQDLIRYAVASSSNDHRLGGHEAPPAIISVYLGDELIEIVNSIISGQPVKPGPSRDLNTGVGLLPRMTKDTSDRNRTSPFSWTGNKFEVRCVGSSQRPAVSLIMLNCLLADSFKYLTEQVNSYKLKGETTDVIIKKVIKETLTKHQRIINNGNNYSEEWRKEAEERGLKNYMTTPDVLAEIINERNLKMFDELKVWTEEEFRGVITVDMEKYIKIAHYEANTVRHMADNFIIPAAVLYMKRMASIGDRAPKARFDKLAILVSQAVKFADELGELVKKIDPHHLDDNELKSLIFYARDKVSGKREELRVTLDNLEEIMDNSLWPFPTYNTILSNRPHT